MRVYPLTVYIVCLLSAGVLHLAELRDPSNKPLEIKVIIGMQQCFRVCVRDDATGIFYLLPSH